MKRIHLLLIVIIALAVVAGWFAWEKLSIPKQEATPTPEITNNGVVQDKSGKTVLYWYDPMAPGQKFDRPGKSPFMDMQLEPKYADESNKSGDNGVVVPSQVAQNLGIRLEKVATRSFGESLSAIGRIEPDERRFYVVQTRIPGFVERLFVRAVGDPVSKGQKIAEVYAPELLSAQQEYLALLTLNDVDSDNSLKQAARHRLKLLGMTEGEIVGISKTGKSSPRFGVYAPASGVLTELGVREGGQLMTGSSLMQISDLSQVWLIAEVPERDAARLKPGLAAEVQLQGMPGEMFKGKVSYLYPILNEVSRTLQVRVELPNKHNLLRPGMYANAKFIGQTHEALSAPSESIIATGKRKVVIVKEAHGYRPVEIETGQERDSFTEILSGLSEGEEVVASGQFLVDSEASLSGVLARLSQQDKAMEERMSHVEMNDTKTSKDNAEKMPEGRGKVIEIDAKSGKVTLAHEPIKELDWPAMTMGFKVKDNKQLEKLKAGDEVEFALKANEQEGYMIERIRQKAAMKDGMKGATP